MEAREPNEPHEPIDADLFVRVYDRAGGLVWNRAAEGEEGRPDRDGQLAVDASGRMYVAGASHQGDRAFDAAVWPYDPPQP